MNTSAGLLDIVGVSLMDALKCECHVPELSVRTI